MVPSYLAKYFLNWQRKVFLVKKEIQLQLWKSPQFRGFMKVIGNLIKPTSQAKRRSHHNNFGSPKEPTLEKSTGLEIATNTVAFATEFLLFATKICELATKFSCLVAKLRLFVF